MDNKKTIKEFADELGISKNRMNYQVSKLNTDYILKLNGVKYLTSQAQEEIKSSLGIKSSIGINSTLNSELNNFKHQIKQLENQLLSKDEQINKLHDLIDQQQQLTLQANKQIEQLQSQLVFLLTDNDEQAMMKEESFDDKKENESVKKWYHFWK